VITDPAGTVVQTNLAMDQLIRRRPGRGARPIVTWFEVADRGRVRNMIARMQRSSQAGKEGSAAEKAMLRLADGKVRPVVLGVTTAIDLRSKQAVLRWEVRADLDDLAGEGPPTEAGPRLVHQPGRAQLAEAPVTDDPPAVRRDHLSLPLAEALATMAGQLAACSDLQGVLQGLVENAVAIIPGAQRAAVWLPRKTSTLTAASDDVALACLGAQMEGRDLPAEGPIIPALAEDRMVVTTLPEMHEQWPRLARVAARADIRRVLAVPVSYGEQPLGVLSVFSGHPDAFGPSARDVAPLVAVQAAVAISQMYREEHLQFALSSRQHIGEAVGILVERHRILPDEAFQRLVKASQDRNVKVREIADVVIQTGQDPEELKML
jgi:hypothetical protein